MGKNAPSLHDGAPVRAEAKGPADLQDLKGDEEVTLVRTLGFWGSFSLGYADVGADIFLALGVVVTWAMGAAPLAFFFASILYACTGLSYAELAAAYPVAGGGAIYARKSFGDLAGFIAGWGLLLDYTIDIPLFALVSIGYLGFFIPPLHDPLLFGPVAALLVGILIILNYIGIRESAFLNVVFVVLGIIGLISVLILGFATSWSWGMVVGQIHWGTEPPLEYFFYAVSIATVSFIGLESISQAAEETRNPGRIIPKTTLTLIASIIFFSVVMALLAVGVVPWQLLAQGTKDPMAVLASALPFGFIVAPFIAFIGATLCYVSANSGIVGVSRVTYEMGRSNLLPQWFNRLHPKYRTPYRSIIVFSAIGIALAFLGDLEFLVDLYNVGALVNYMMVNLSMIRLRNTHAEDPRPWRCPGVLRIPWRGKRLEIPINALVGFVACATVWLMIIFLHPWGRIGGAIWFFGGAALYAFYRRRRGLPLLTAGEEWWPTPHSSPMPPAPLSKAADNSPKGDSVLT